MTVIIPSCADLRDEQWMVVGRYGLVNVTVEWLWFDPVDAGSRTLDINGSEGSGLLALPNGTIVNSNSTSVA